MSYSKPAGQDVLFEETFADVWRNAQRRRSAYLGSWIDQLFRPRNDADLRPAGDDVFWMREAGRNCDPAACVLLART